jgi:hypothetical protein
MNKGPLSPLRVSEPSDCALFVRKGPLPYQSDAIMIISTRMVVVGLSGVSAP